MRKRKSISDLYRQIYEHHGDEWPESLLNMPLRKLLDDLKNEGGLEKDLYNDLEDFIENYYKPNSMSKENIKESVILQESSDDRFEDENVQVWLHIDGPREILLQYDYDTTQKTDVKYVIQIGWRRWGIDGAHIYPTEIKPFEAELIHHTDDGGETIKPIVINIDAGKINVEYIKSNSIAIKQLDIYADLNGNVNYNRSVIEIFSPFVTDNN